MLWGEGEAVSAVVYHGKGIAYGSWANAAHVRTQREDSVEQIAHARLLGDAEVCLNVHVCSVLRAEEPRLWPQIVVRRRVDPDAWRIRGDDGLIEEMVLALALNALDAIEDEGRVTFETRNLVLREGCITRATGLAPGPYVMLTVEDTGRGMDAGTLSQVFEPAMASASAPNRPVLAGVMRIARLHHGHVCVSSAPREGTTVRVYLPAEPPA